MKKAVIFDMDGVVSDTQKFHAEAESLVLKKYGISMAPEDITYRYAGVSDDVMFREIFEENGIKLESADKLIFIKWDLMAQIAKGRIEAIKHAPELIKNLKQDGFKLAIASSSTKNFINNVLNELNLTDYFDALVSSEEVKKGKPAPDIFLLAASRLGAKAEDSVVVEDGKSGMIGAARANMKCIGLISDMKNKDEYPADKIVVSLSDVTPQAIHNL